MQKKPKVHYISLYNIPQFYRENRKYSLSGSKMEYIVEAINDAGYDVNFISLSESRNKRIYLPKSCKWKKRNRFFLAPYVPCKFSESIMFRWLLHIYSLFYIRKGDILLVYHTNCMRNDILSRLAQKKKMTFVYEVEEVYAFVHESIDKNIIEDEINRLQCAERWLFASEKLNQLVNHLRLPHAIVEGTYKYIDLPNDSFNDGKVHCVYSGMIDELQRGAHNAVLAGQYLDEKYVIHILGYGDIESIKKLIVDVSKNTRCKIEFNGSLKGVQFLQFLNRCNIGLNTRNINGEYNDASIPSKVATYISVGLPVVSGAIAPIKKSSFADLVTFYQHDNPQEIAEAIKSAPTKHVEDCKQLFKNQHERFVNELKNVFNGEER